ncbi:MAG: hypothetical protein ACE5J7_04500 [Candidatus Aenigmatarchaeota archaeon]
MYLRKLSNLTRKYNIPEEFIVPTYRYIKSHSKRRKDFEKNFFKRFSKTKRQRRFTSKRILIKNKRHPVEFARLRMHIRGDGGISKSGYVFYYNSDKALLNEFINDSKKVFKNTNVCIVGDKVYLSRNVSRFFIEKCGYIPGLEITHNLGVDLDILKCNKIIKSQAIRAYFDDEARFHSNAIEIVRTRDMGFLPGDTLKKAIQNPRKYHKYAPRFLHDLRSMLKDLEIDTGLPFVYKGDLLMHVDVYGFLRLSVPWRFLITGESNLRRYYELVGFKSEKKMKMLGDYLRNIKVHKARKNKSIKLAIKNCKDLQSRRGFITVSYLAEFSNRSVRHSRRWIYKLLELNKIKLIQGRTVYQDNKGRMYKGSDEFKYKLC